jgi:hypothetical protein
MLEIDAPGYVGIVVREPGVGRAGNEEQFTPYGGRRTEWEA